MPVTVYIKIVFLKNGKSSVVQRGKLKCFGIPYSDIVVNGVYPRNCIWQRGKGQYPALSAPSGLINPPLGRSYLKPQQLSAQPSTLG